MISMLSNRSLWKLQLKSLFRYCTTTAAADAAAPRTVMAEFLINSLDFSKEEALTATKKIPPSKSFRNDPNLVIGYMETLGFNKPQIKRIVTIYPRVLLPDPQTLQPKIKALQDIGFSGSDIVAVLTRYGSLLCRPLKTHYLAPIECLKGFLGSKELVCKVLLKNGSLLHVSTVKKLAPTLAYLQKSGCSEKQLSQLMIRNPKYLKLDITSLEDIVMKMEDKYRIPRNSKMFFHLLVVFCTMSTTTIEKKFNVFRSFGWSESDIDVMFRNAPYCVGSSEDRLRKVLDYYTNEVGYTVDFLASRAAIFNYSLERRVQPRVKIMKMLKEKKLIDEKCCFYTGLTLTDINFIKRFILPYLDNAALSVTDLEFLKNYILPHKDEVASLLASNLKLCSKSKKRDKKTESSSLSISKIEPS